MPATAPARRRCSTHLLCSRGQSSAPTQTGHLPLRKNASASTRPTGRRGPGCAGPPRPPFASIAERSRPGLLLWRDLLQQLHWSGEIFHISLQLPSLADSIARIDPTLALELTAIAGAIVPHAVFDGIAPYERLARAIDDLGPDAVEAARSRAASMSYDAAMEHVFEGIDRLMTETAEP